MSQTTAGSSLLLAMLLAVGCAAPSGGRQPAEAEHRTQAISEGHFRLEYRARGSADQVQTAALREAARQVSAAGHDWFAAQAQLRTTRGVSSVLLDVYPGRGVRPDSPHTWAADAESFPDR